MLFDSVHKIRQQFGYYNPTLVLKLIGIYSTSLYGSPLWELYSPAYEKLIRSWNTVTKMSWNLPFSTHTRLLEPLSPIPHLGSTLEGRYIGFIDSLYNSSKDFLKQILSSCIYDQRTVTGRNIDLLLRKHQKQGLESLIQARSNIKRRKLFELGDEELYKIGLIEDLSLFLGGHIELDMSEEDASEILQYICTS